MNKYLDDVVEFEDDDIEFLFWLNKYSGQQTKEKIFTTKMKRFKEKHYEDCDLQDMEW